LAGLDRAMLRNDARVESQKPPPLSAIDRRGVVRAGRVGGSPCPSAREGLLVGVLPQGARVAGRGLLLWGPRPAADPADS
jgi:hypothetical protein